MVTPSGAPGEAMKSVELQVAGGVLDIGQRRSVAGPVGIGNFMVRVGGIFAALVGVDGQPWVGEYRAPVDDLLGLLELHKLGDRNAGEECPKEGEQGRFLQQRCRWDTEDPAREADQDGAHRDVQS